MAQRQPGQNQRGGANGFRGRGFGRGGGAKQKSAANPLVAYNENERTINTLNSQAETIKKKEEAKRQQNFNSVKEERKKEERAKLKGPAEEPLRALIGKFDSADSVRKSVALAIPIPVIMPNSRKIKTAIAFAGVVMTDSVYDDVEYNEPILRQVESFETVKAKVPGKALLSALKMVDTKATPEEFKEVIKKELKPRDADVDIRPFNTDSIRM